MRVKVSAAVATLSLALFASSALAQEPLAAIPSIQHDPVGCFLAGEYPVLEAGIQAEAGVASARCYFSSVLTPDWYYVEATLTGEGAYICMLPPPTMDAGPVSYYIQVVSLGGQTTQTPEFAARVVEGEGDCEDRLAAWRPDGVVRVFSAAGILVGMPAGFGVAAGAAIGTTTAVIAGGAVAAGLATALVVTPGEEPPASPSR